MTTFEQVTIDPVSSSSEQGLIINQTAAGSVTNGVSTPFNTNDYGLNFINVSSDDIQRPTSGNANKTAAQLILHEYGGSDMVGGRDSLDVLSVLQSASSSNNNDHDYQAANLAFYSNVNDSGTSTAAKGACFALGGAAILDGGATYWSNITFMEANVAVVTGASVSYKTLIQLASLSQDAVRGSAFDTMIGMSSESGAIGWTNGILFGPMNGQQPLSPQGTLLATTGSATVAAGIDISSYSYAGNAIHTPGFAVDSSGDVTTRGIVSHNGISGTIFQNLYNIFWTGSSAHLYIEDVDQGAFTFTCDPRVKNIVSRSIPRVLDRIEQLEFVTYRFRNVGIYRDDGVERHGVSASQIQTMFPPAVNGSPNAVDGKGDPIPQTVNIPELIPVILKALQELKAEIDAIKSAMAPP